MAQNLIFWQGIAADTEVEKGTAVDYKVSKGTKPEGSGIGLSLSRQIMRMHGGTLRLTRSDSEATVFTLIFK